MRTNPVFDFTHLSATERVELALDLWDSLEPAELDVALPVSDEQRAELDRRLDDLDRHPEASVPWDQVRADLQANLDELRRAKRGA